jgi:protein SCO1/2
MTTGIEHETRRRKTPRGVMAAMAGLSALIVVLLIAVVPRLLQGGGSGEALIGGPFALIDQDGRTVSDADFRGRFMLIYFGYTFCPDVCPTTLATMAQAYDSLPPDERRKLALIFITVDPERDTADQIGQYVENFSPDLIGLTGSPEQIRKVLAEYRVYARKGEDDGGNYAVNHSSIVYLMGPDGKYLNHFPGTTSATDLAAGISRRLGR